MIKEITVRTTIEILSDETRSPGCKHFILINGTNHATCDFFGRNISYRKGRYFRCCRCIKSDNGEEIEADYGESLDDEF
jgi:hypothetical protein